MAHLKLDPKRIARCRELARQVARPVETLIDTHTTVAIERATLRLLGANGAILRGGQAFPEVNAIIEDLSAQKALERGALRWFVNGMIQTKMTATELSAAVASKKVSLTQLPQAK